MADKRLGIIARLRRAYSALTLSELDKQLDQAATGSPTFTGVAVGENSALNYTAVYACVRVRAETLASLSLHLYRRQDGGAEKATDHKLYYMMHDAPNEEMTSVEMLETSQAHYDTWGNAYLWLDVPKVGRNAGYIQGVYPLKPDKVTARRVDGRLQYGYQRQRDDGSSETLTYDVSQVLHVPALGYDGVVGYSPVGMARQAIGLGLALEEFGARYFGQGTHPAGVMTGVTTPVGWTLDSFNTYLQNQFAGLGKAHGIMALTGDAKYQTLTMPLEDAQFLTTRRFQLAEIARIYRVPLHLIADLEKATFCLPADTLVYTTAGPQQIADLEAGDWVWSHNEGGEWVQSRVLRSECTGEDEILTIKCRNRTIRCNARHRLAVWREHREACEGGRGRYVLENGQKCRKTWGIEWVPAGDLEVGDQLVGVTELPDLGGESCPTRLRVSVGFMESLGLLMGDGFYARNKVNGTGSTFGFSHGEKDEHVAHYAAMFEQEFERFDGPYGRKNGGTVKLEAKQRDKNTTVFYSGAAYDELEKLGIIGTAKTKRVPSWVFGLSRELRLAFLRGYLDADGTVNKNGQIRFVSVNRELLEDMRHLCIGVGVPVGSVHWSDIKSKFGDRAYVHRLFGFDCCNAKANAEVGSHISPYRERWAHRLETIRKRRVTKYPNEVKSRDCGRGLAPTGILEIIKSDPEPVYDLCVENTHNFVADGMLVHNSNIEQQALEFAMFTMMPLARKWEKKLNLRLLTERERAQGYFFEFDMNSLMRGDNKSRGEFYNLMRQAGVFSPNEIREKENMNPRDGGDEYWDAGPSGQQPSGQASLAPVFADAATRIRKRETTDLTAAAERYAKRDDGMVGFTGWLDEYWARHTSFCAAVLRPAYTAQGAPEEADRVAAEHVERLRLVVRSAAVGGFEGIREALEARAEGSDAHG